MVPSLERELATEAAREDLLEPESDGLLREEESAEPGGPNGW